MMRNTMTKIHGANDKNGSVNVNPGAGSELISLVQRMEQRLKGEVK